MRAATLSYRRRATPLHAAAAPVAALYVVALGVAGLIVSNPIPLAAMLIAVVGVGRCCGVGADMARVARRLTIPMVVVTVLVNVLVDREGLTVFARLGDFGPFGQMDLTVEAAVYGVIVAVHLMILILAGVLLSDAVDPDRLMSSLRWAYPRSALGMTLTTRMVGVLARDAQRLADAQRCRPDRGRGGTRGRLTVLRAVIAGSLDRSLDVAATLEVRGYGAAGVRRPPRAPRPLSRHDLDFASAAAALLVIAIVTRTVGAASFHVYPLIHLSVGVVAVVGGLLLGTMALAPFRYRRGIDR